MNIPNDLPESVQQLMRPRLALRSERDSQEERFVGIWGGIGAVPLPPQLSRSRLRHWISVDCWWLEENGFGVRGCLSVYRAGGDVSVVHDPDLVFDDSPANGLALFGLEEASLPEIEVLEAYLGEDEATALMSQGWAEEYIRFARTTNPISREDMVAVLGGWHLSWPDGPPCLPRLAELQARIDAAHGPGCLPQSETYRCEPYRLLLWTLRDSEPWIEVWGDGAGELHAVERIT